MKAARYCISVLTYSQTEHAKKCLASVVEHSADYELILTANGNADAARYFKEFAEAHPELRVRIVVNAENLGFIIPSNRAFEMSESERHILLNDDTEVPALWLAALEHAFWKDSRCVLVCPTGGCNSIQPDGHGYFNPMTTDYCEGACLMIRTAEVRKLGPTLFSDYLKHSYVEDADLSLRATQAGFTIATVDLPTPGLIHHRAQTSAKIPGLAEIAEENRKELVRRWGPLLKMRQNPRKILIRRDAAFGDVLLLSPVIRAIKRAFSGWPIFVDSLCFEVLAGNPDVAGPGTVGDMPEALVIELNGSYERQPEKHILQCYTEDAERALGVPLAVRKDEMFLACDPHELAVERSVFASGKWVAIHAGPSWPSKSWDAWSWSKLINQLIQDGWNVVLVGHAVQGVFAGLPCTKDRRGKTSISRLAAVLSCCKLGIVIDSLVLHAASAVKLPCVQLYGATRAAMINTSDRSIAVESDPTHPVSGLRHKVKNAVSLAEDGSVMDTITVEQVLEAFRKLSSNKG